jgi:alpha-mannosidase
MVKQLLLAISVLPLLVLAASPVHSAARQKRPKPAVPRPIEGRLADAAAVRIMSSSHQDIAWMDSPEKCMIYRDESCITPALAMMARDPAYRFTMENMLNLKEYLDRHPERRDEVLRYTKAGRLEWGATFNQPYESLLSGEELVRQVYFGRRWLKKTLPGCDARVAFNPDVPGRALQMSQILSKAGIPYLVISRYHEGFYRWASPDGSSVLAFTPGHYGNASSILNAAPAEGLKAVAAALEKWTPYYAERRLPPVFPLLNSVDFSKPTDFGGLIAAWNNAHRGRSSGPAPAMGYASAREFFEALDAPGVKLDVVTGERPNLWLYIHGPTHHQAISAHREAGRLLPAAEAFSTFRSLLEGSFRNYPAREFEEAWQAAIYPDHGWGGKEGQVTDRLFRKKYEQARDTGRRLLDAALESIAGRVEARRDRGTPIVVFNALSWKRTDPVRVTLKDPGSGFSLLDGEGEAVTYQALAPLPDQAPGMIRLEFIAADVPPLGYRTWYMIADRSIRCVQPGVRYENGVFENAFYRAELVPGGLKALHDRELGRNVLETGKFLGFELFTMQSVGSGAGEFGRVQQPTMEGFDKLSLHRPVWTLEATDSGPVRTVFGLRQALGNCVVRQKLVFYNDIKRVDCEVEILDWDGEPYREFRLAVPVAAPGGRTAYEVPMGVVEVGRSEIQGTGGPAYGNLNYDELCSEIRPREVQNFITAEGRDFGVTLATSVAVCDFKDPTPDPAGYPILQPVLFASRRSCHGEGNWYLQEGDHAYRFSLFTHAGGWRDGGRAAIQANNPLLPVVRTATPKNAGPGRLPDTKSLFSVSAPNVLVGTIKKAEDDDSVVIRVYELEGRDVETNLDFFMPVAAAEKTNIIEEEGVAIRAGKTGVKIPVGRHAIETVKLRPGKK